MSTYHATTLDCPKCQQEMVVDLIESANVARFPACREEVLSRSFMRFSCDACAADVVVERQLLYTDLNHGLFVLVFPSPNFSPPSGSTFGSTALARPCSFGSLEGSRHVVTPLTSARPRQHCASFGSLEFW